MASLDISSLCVPPCRHRDKPLTNQKTAEQHVDTSQESSVIFYLIAYNGNHFCLCCVNCGYPSLRLFKDMINNTESRSFVRLQAPTHAGWHQGHRRIWYLGAESYKRWQTGGGTVFLLIVPPLFSGDLEYLACLSHSFVHCNSNLTSFQRPISGDQVIVTLIPI